MKLNENKKKPFSDRTNASRLSLLKVSQHQSITITNYVNSFAILQFHVKWEIQNVRNKRR